MDKRIIQKIDRFYAVVFDEIIGDLQSLQYKGIFLGEIVVKTYLNGVINNPDFIRKIENDRVENLSDFYILDFKKSYFQRISSPSIVKSFVRDLARYVYYLLLSIKQPSSDNDIYFFIPNFKFKNYLEGVEKSLRDQSLKFAYLLWERNRLPSSKGRDFILPRPAFPYFWHKQYYKFHEFTTQVDRALGWAKVIEGKKILFVEGCFSTMHVSALIARKYRCNSYCLQWGFFGKTATKAGWRNMPYDKYLVWGEFFRNEFVKYNPNLTIQVSGHPNLSNGQLLPKSKVLFAIQKKLAGHINEEEVNKFVAIAIQFAVQNPEKSIILRSHPDFDLPKIKLDQIATLSNVVVHDSSRFSLEDSFKEAKYCISISSSTSIESVIKGCFPLYLKINELPLQVHAVFEEFHPGYHVITESQLQAHLEKLDKMDLENYLNSLKQQMFLPEEKIVENLFS
ncbi:hypothetical protein [Pararhodonellum marinum]|uniref:hypothetical protein n=1 Tax=Pararhodonellum marinum TaxID=2755358 RepID=UPI00188FE561|nr:hypothetical protein [Pararhodonellum marinum]